MRAVDELADQAHGEPTVEDLQGTQHNDEPFVVHVSQQGPVQTHPMPADLSPVRLRKLVLAAPPVPVANYELRRSVVTLMADATFWFGSDPAAVADQSSGWWPANTPLYWRSREQLWAMAGDADVSLTVVQDLWTG